MIRLVRSEISSRLPIGVEIMNRVPDNASPFEQFCQTLLVSSLLRLLPFVHVENSRKIADLYRFMHMSFLQVFDRCRYLTKQLKC